VTWLSELLFPVSFRPRRKIGAFTATVTLEEIATDELEITSHPVQNGANISDNAYVKPATLAMRCMWSEADAGMPLDELYTKLRELQASRIPFDVVTGKRIYKNMLMKSLGETTDKATNNILNISMTLQEILIVDVVTTRVPVRSKQRDAGRTGATEPTGKKTAQSETRKKSVLLELAGG